MVRQSLGVRWWCAIALAAAACGVDDPALPTEARMGVMDGDGPMPGDPPPDPPGDETGGEEADEPCLVGPDSDASENGPDGNPLDPNDCRDHLLVQGCSHMADVDVIAIHDAQPMVEASVLGHAVTQTLASGLGCNAAIGLPTQQARSRGEAETGDANYTFVAQAGCEDSFTVSALNILQVLASPTVDATFAVDLQIGDA